MLWLIKNIKDSSSSFAIVENLQLKKRFNPFALPFSLHLPVRMNSREHKDKENDIQDLIWKRIG